MRATAWRVSRWGRFATVVVLASILIGCGAEDLYRLPDSPFVQVGHLPLPTINKDVVVLGDYAYVAADQAGLHVVDISDPTQPVLVRTVDTDKSADDVVAIRTFPPPQDEGGERILWDIALIAEGTEGIRAYDIRDPLNAQALPVSGSTAIDVNSAFVVLNKDPDLPHTVYQAESWHGIRALFSEPTEPGNYARETWTHTLGSAMDIEVRGNYAFVADDQMGLSVVDVSGSTWETTGRVVSWADTPGNALSIALDGNYAYIADKRQGLAVFDISDPLSPVHIKQLPLDGWCLDIEIRDDWAFIAADDAGTHIIDISDRQIPQHVGSVRSSNARGVGVSPLGYILVADEDDGILILRGPSVFQDKTPPAPIYTLEAEPYGFTQINLKWFATGDDGYMGQASAYEIHWDRELITDESDWDSAEGVITNPPVPLEVATEQSYLVGGLNPGTEYYFTMKVRDDEGLVSPIGKNATAVTEGAGTLLRSGSLDLDWGLVDDTYTFEVTYLDWENQAPVIREMIIDETAYEMQFVEFVDGVEGDYTTGAIYRLTTSELGAGDHVHRFHFDDGDGHSVYLPSMAEDPFEGPLVGLVAFTMGTPEDELLHIPDDEGQHTVLLGRELVVADHEVLQVDWNELMPSNPSTFVGDSLPVQGANWYDAVRYCNELSDLGGLTPAYDINDLVNPPDVTWNREADGWRLPTEAEWEYFCRAGTSTAFYNGDITSEGGFDPILDLAGWYIGNSDYEAQVAGRKAPNAFGLYDLHGNVAEWCWDWYGAYSEEVVLDPEGPEDGFDKIIRGGHYERVPAGCRSAARGTHIATSGNDFVGFRVVRTQF